MARLVHHAGLQSTEREPPPSARTDASRQARHNSTPWEPFQRRATFPLDLKLPISVFKYRTPSAGFAQLRLDAQRASGDDFDLEFVLVRHHVPGGDRLRDSQRCGDRRLRSKTR